LGASQKLSIQAEALQFKRHLKVTSVGRKMQCAYTSHVEDILKALERKSHGRQLITNGNKCVLLLSVAGVCLQHFDVSNVCVGVFAATWSTNTDSAASMFPPSTLFPWEEVFQDLSSLCYTPQQDSSSTMMGDKLNTPEIGR
jgi:hypothetical protein